MKSGASVAIPTRLIAFLAGKLLEPISQPAPATFSLIAHGHPMPPFGASKRSVAQDRRAARKRRAIRRARKLGQA